MTRRILGIDDNFDESREFTSEVAAKKYLRKELYTNNIREYMLVAQKDELNDSIPF